jgi:hypothetical protein
MNEDDVNTQLSWNDQSCKISLILTKVLHIFT